MAAHREWLVCTHQCRCAFRHVPVQTRIKHAPVQNSVCTHPRNHVRVLVKRLPCKGLQYCSSYSLLWWGPGSV